MALVSVKWLVVGAMGGEYAPHFTLEFRDLEALPVPGALPGKRVTKLAYYWH